MANVREAAMNWFKNFSAPDRAAIYTVSGKDSIDLTNDARELRDAVSKIHWSPGTGSGMRCPDVSYYVADLIITRADGQALAALTNHTAECAIVRPEVARQIAEAAANREMIIGAQNARLALSTLRRAVRRLAAVPGERVIILASQGFLTQTPESTRALAEILDLAARNNVIINGLSVRGVIVAEEEEDVTRKMGIGRRAPPRATTPDQLWLRYRREGARADGDAMNDLAQGTGGIFFHNNNDLRIGFERAAGVPEFSYVLGFSPAEWKGGETFHLLKVRLKNEKGATIEARRGYALKPDPKSQSSTESLEDAIFSRDVKDDIPVVLQTGYSKPNGADLATVLATAKIDLGRGPTMSPSPSSIRRVPTSPASRKRSKVKANPRQRCTGSFPT
jgi:VWFA-related protein